MHKAEMTLQLTRAKKNKTKPWNALRTEWLCKYKKWYRILNSWRTEQRESTYNNQIPNHRTDGMKLETTDENFRKSKQKKRESEKEARDIERRQSSKQN